MEEHFGNKLELCLPDLRGIKKEFAIYHIPECDVYLHSVYTLDYNEQISIVKNLRARYPKAKHIAGGPHAAVFQEECLEIFDSLILGDGEESIIKSVNDFLDNNLKKNYYQEMPIDINIYPYPKRKWLPNSTVSHPGLISVKNKKGYENLLSTTVIFSRGCSHKCAFCYMPAVEKYRHGPRLRFRKPELIEEEIEYLKKDYNIKAISLLDEIGFPPNPKKAIPHIEAIGRTGIVWKAQCRVETVTDEIAKLLRESGCVIICLGAESVSQKSLDIINKKIKLAQTRKAIQLLQNNDIEVRLYMIIGLPGEADDIVEQTWTFIKETNPAWVYLCLLSVRPGTDMYDNPQKYGFKWVNTDWGKTMHLFSRYKDEIPNLTFEYQAQASWGNTFTNEQIINNYLELQRRIKENGYGPF
ncbi:MAG: radical SAM protein [Elusimicrobiota bacterium]